MTAMAYKIQISTRKVSRIMMIYVVCEELPAQARQYLIKSRASRSIHGISDYSKQRRQTPDIQEWRSKRTGKRQPFKVFIF
jgi:hypothetical protein